MIDAAQLDALAAVLREGSFERAAQALHLTRSAVSQRVKLLEERVGHVLVRRGSPCTATAEGERVHRHALERQLAEHEMLLALRAEGGDGDGPVPDGAPPRTLAVAVNADTLATWFIAAIAPLATAGRALFDLQVEDQDHSAGLLRQGRVMAAVTADPQPVQGCVVRPLGAMRYRAIASPAFMDRWFGGRAQGVTGAALARAPMLVYNRQDALQARFVRRIAHRALQPPVHWVPSSQGFVDAALAGLGWGMVPEAMIGPALARGELQDLAPGRPTDVPLYWQQWRLDVGLLRDLEQAVLAAAARALVAPGARVGR